MNLAHRITGAVRGRFHRACSGYLHDKFVSPFFDAHEIGSKYWSDVLEAAGVELIEVIRVRRDTKGVFLVEHPEHGRSILKTVFAASRPAQGLANQAIAGIISESGSPIFPRVFGATRDYTVEQYIDGRRFREWLSTDFRQDPIREYFMSLKDWSKANWGSDSNARLSPYEIREICRFYIVKCLGHTQYFPTASRVRSARRFAKESGELAARISWLWKAAERVSLPRGIMCGDMGEVNILVQRGTDRIFNIDYEFMGPGHRGFDCAYFLSSLSKMGDPKEAEVISFIKNIVLTEDYLGGADAEEFFKEYTEVLSEIGRTVYGAT